MLICNKESTIMGRMDVVRRTQLILGGYFYAHNPVLLGIVAMAAGVKKVIGHAHLDLAPAITLAVGVSLVLIGEVCFRRALGLPSARPRLWTAALALAAFPLGLWSASLHLAALVALLIVMLAFERGTEAAWSASPEGFLDGADQGHQFG
jgi:low temperature requirement protein LtrA